MAVDRKTKRASIYYVDNKKFYQEMKDYIAVCREAEESGDEYPIVPNYLGECFYKIATKLSTRLNFSNYSYRDEMIGDAIENCIHYVRSFNPDKSNNPFAYFTQIAWNSFVHRINKERKQQYVKYKSMEHMIINHDISGMITPEMHENTQKFISSYEESIEKAKKKKEEKKEKKLLEQFIEDD